MTKGLKGEKKKIKYKSLNVYSNMLLSRTSCQLRIYSH